MEAIAHDPAFAHRAGVPVGVGREFVSADMHGYASGGSIDHSNDYKLTDAQLANLDPSWRNFDFSPAGSSTDSTLNTWAHNLTPDQLPVAWGSLGGYGIAGAAGGNPTTGASFSGEDAIGQPVTTSGYSMFAPTAGGGQGGWQNYYDPSGTFLGQHYNTPDSALTKLTDKGIEAALAYAVGGVAMGAMGGPVLPGVAGAAPTGGTIGAEGLTGASSFGGAVDPALAVQGNSINALDNMTGVDYGTQVDPALTTQGDSINALDAHTGVDYGSQFDPSLDVQGNSTNVLDHATGVDYGSPAPMGGPSLTNGVNFTNPFTLNNAATAVKVAGALASAGGAAGGGSGGGGGGGATTTTTGPTTPFDYGPARYLPQGWRTDRPMYVPGQDAIPVGWLGAGGVSG